MINTLLAATDGSTHARKALEVAIDLAAKYDAKLVVMHVMGHGEIPEGLAHMAEIEHVVDPEPPDYSLPRATVTHAGTKHSRDNLIHSFIGEKLLEEAEQLAKKNGVANIHSVMEDGDPASCILKTAEGQNADFIVMGTRGLGNLKGLLVGSVSQKVNHLAQCTCVFVK